LGAPPGLNPRLTRNAIARQVSPTAWFLEIPPGPAGEYRLSQLDDYSNLSRRGFPWRAPLRLRLQARVSQAALPGTWGFGFWNEPFGLALGFGGGARRLPALPNAAWFFFASPENYLSLRDDLPAHGALAATFQSRNIPTPLLAFFTPAALLLALPPAARLLRQLGRRFIHQSASSLDVDVTAWHAYEIDWSLQQVSFYLDEQLVFQTGVVPQGPLGLVLWIDNQYASLPSDGRLRYGTLAYPESAWLEIEQLALKSINRPTGNKPFM